MAVKYLLLIYLYLYLYLPIIVGDRSEPLTTDASMDA